jgi:hypothetical protein
MLPLAEAWIYAEIRYEILGMHPCAIVARWPWNAGKTIARKIQSNTKQGKLKPAIRARSAIYEAAKAMKAISRIAS